MKVGILSRVDKAEAGELVRLLEAEFTARGAEVLLEENTAAMIGASAGIGAEDLAERCDVLVILGGDGTILRALHRLRGPFPPVFGINLGSLGFLTSVSSENWEKAVETIASGKFELKSRTLLRVELCRDGKVLETFTGLNDVVVSRGHHSQLIKLRVVVDGEELSVYNADGLIVATPTGSTAYSMSAGGPLLMPGSACFVITPICPHVFTNRSTVISDEARLELRLLGGGPGVTVNVDGQEIRDFCPEDELRVSRSDEKLRLATLPGRTFSNVLREKLKWSGTNV